MGGWHAFLEKIGAQIVVGTLSALATVSAYLFMLAVSNQHHIEQLKSEQPLHHDVLDRRFSAIQREVERNQRDMSTGFTRHERLIEQARAAAERCDSSCPSSN